MFNARNYVESILMVPDIVNLTGDNTIHYIHATSPVEPYIEYEFYDEDGAVWEEGKEISTNFYLQVDIFSKGSFENLANIVKEKMINAGFERGKAADLYESNTKLFHKAMRFVFTANN